MYKTLVGHNALPGADSVTNDNQCPPIFFKEIGTDFFSEILILFIDHKVDQISLLISCRI